MRCLLGLILLAGISPSLGNAANLTERIESAATAGKFTQMMLYRSNSSATARM